GMDLRRRPTGGRSKPPESPRHPAGGRLRWVAGVSAFRKDRPMRPLPTLLACAALAFSGPAPARDTKADQERAVAALQKLGGKITTDDARPGHPVVAVSFAYRPVTDADLTALKDLPALESLDLRVTRITDAAAAHLKGLATLKALNLSGTK